MYDNPIRNVAVIYIQQTGWHAPCLLYIYHVSYALGITSVDEYLFAIYYIYTVRAMTPPAITMIFNTPGITVHVPATALAAYRSNPNWRTYRLVGDL